MATYTITGDTGGSWGDPMSAQAYRVNEAAQGANSDIYNWSGAFDTSLWGGDANITKNNITHNMTGATFDATSGANNFEIEDATGVTFNGGTATLGDPSGPSEWIAWGVSTGSNTPSGTVNDMTVLNSKNQAFQNYAASVVTYNNCDVSGCDDDAMSCHDASVITADGGTWENNGTGLACVNTSTFIGSNLTIQDNTDYDVQCSGNATSVTTLTITDSYIKGSVVGNKDSGSEVTATFERVIFDCKSVSTDTSSQDAPLQFGRGGSSADTVHLTMTSCEMRKPPTGLYSLWLRAGNGQASEATLTNCGIVHNTKDAYGVRIVGGDIDVVSTNLNIYNTSSAASDAAIKVSGTTSTNFDYTNFDNVDAEFDGTPTSNTNAESLVFGYVDADNDDFNVLAEDSLQMGAGNNSVLPLNDLNDTAFLDPPAIGQFTFIVVTVAPTLTTPFPIGTNNGPMFSATSSDTIATVEGAGFLNDRPGWASLLKTNDVVVLEMSNGTKMYTVTVNQEQRIITLSTGLVIA